MRPRSRDRRLSFVRRERDFESTRVEDVRRVTSWEVAVARGIESRAGDEGLVHAVTHVLYICKAGHRTTRIGRGGVEFGRPHVLIVVELRVGRLDRHRLHTLMHSKSLVYSTRIARTGEQRHSGATRTRTTKNVPQTKFLGRETRVYSLSARKFTHVRAHALPRGTSGRTNKRKGITHRGVCTRFRDIRDCASLLYATSDALMCAGCSSLVLSPSPPRKTSLLSS